VYCAEKEKSGLEVLQYMRFRGIIIDVNSRLLPLSLEGGYEK